jgi:pyruvate kinase
MGPADTFRRAKIMCTVGPASRDPEVLRDLIRAGADAVRINFSHASHEDAAEILSRTREVAADLGRPVAVVGDLQGPKIRVGDLPGPMEIREGESYFFVPEDAPPDAVPEDVAADRVIPVTYPQLVEDVTAGDRVLLDDGRLELRTRNVRESGFDAEAFSTGTLESQKGINLPGVTVGAPSLTAKDREDLAFALESGLDCVALSFVRRPEDVSDLREEVGDRALLIAKIEKDQALEELAEVMRRSDAVMVARGDLGVELPYEEVPLVQKEINRLGHQLARPAITATQMLESMTETPRPTRAEVSDVATALLDGSDAVMLSAETAVGQYPVEAVRAMVRIIRRIEREGPPYRSQVQTRPGRARSRVQESTSGAIAAAAMQAVDRLGSPFMVTFTRSGFTARVVAAQRPPIPILAVTDQQATYRQLALSWGVRPVLHAEGEISYDGMLEKARSVALDGGFGRPGDHFVVTAGVPFHVSGTTNLMRIEEL